MDERRRGNRIGSCVIGSVRLSFVFLLVFFFLVVAVVLRCFFLLVGNGAVGHWSARSTAIGLKSGRNRVGNGFGFSLRIDFFRILIFTDRLRWVFFFFFIDSTKALWIFTGERCFFHFFFWNFPSQRSIKTFKKRFVPSFYRVSCSFFVLFTGFYRV